MPTNWIGLRLDPLDTLFFRDGRPFDAATRATGGLPQPQTLAGAIRTALLARAGFDFRRFSTLRKDDPALMRESLMTCGAPESVVAATFRGPWLALVNGDNAVSPLFPTPETLKRAKDGGWSVAKPIRMGKELGWDDPKLKPLWRKVPPNPKADPELLTMSGLKAFLSGNEPAETDCVKRDELTAADHRVGIAVNADTFTAAESMLYGISLLAIRPKRHDQPAVCLYAEVSGTVAGHFTEPLILPFGGEGKYVRASVVTAQDWGPETVTTTPSVWYLATPTFFPPTGRPLPTPKGTLVAAASGAGVPVSGWDVARNGPKATRFAVPAGAVYFIEGACSPDDFLNAGIEIESASLRQEGWGFALPGTWEGLNP